MSLLLTVADARCRIGPQALLTIDRFHVQVGQHWCLFGPNGAGKSCLGRLIAGQMRESGSYVSYAGAFDPALDVHIVSFEEQQRLWKRDDRLDISEYSESAEDKGTLVEELIRDSRLKKDQNESLLLDLVAELDLVALLTKGIRFLSSGQIRKVLLARALYAFRAEAPQLIILDDPLESIDRYSRVRIESCIAQFLSDSNASLQLCRRQRDIPAGATHMAVMEGLKIVKEGPIESVREGSAYRELVARVPALPELIPTAQNDAGASEEVLIELRGVNASYGAIKVLDNVNWRMQSHNHVLIEGPNGCGKSTLLSLIDGENHKAYGQEVYLFGRRKGSGEAIWDIKKRFGLVSNELHNKYVKGWRVLEVVVSGFFDSVGLYDTSGSKETGIARQWLATFSIAGLEKQYYHTLSFGQQRLVLLARAMVKNPAILILDEPCVGLDDYYRQLILHTLDLIASRTRTRLIYVSHVEGEQPECINQTLRFHANRAGGYDLIESGLN